MKIRFVGTGGGRVNLVEQKRRTGGFVIEGSLRIWVDPGPGALVYGKEMRIHPKKIDGIVVTHYHLDHANDACALIEGMTEYGFKKRGFFIGSKYSVDGDEKGNRVLDTFHRSLPEKVIIGEPGGSADLGRAVFHIKKAVHDESTTFGFVLEMDRKRIGYTSDTEYYQGIEGAYAGCDLLIVNSIKPKVNIYKGHMHMEEAIKLIKESKVKKGIITHLGYEYEKVNLEKIEKREGIRFAKDGETIGV